MFEVEKDINSNMLKASSGSLMHLTRNMMSSSSSQYIKGSKCKEISRDLLSRLGLGMMYLVALLCTLSRRAMSFKCRGLHSWEQ